MEIVDVQQELFTFIVETLRMPETKENPKMVAAISELYRSCFY